MLNEFLIHLQPKFSTQTLNENNDINSLFIFCKSTKLFNEVTFFYNKISKDKIEFRNLNSKIWTS